MLKAQKIFIELILVVELSTINSIGGSWVSQSVNLWTLDLEFNLWTQVMSSSPALGSTLHVET